MNDNPTCAVRFALGVALVVGLSGCEGVRELVCAQRDTDLKNMYGIGLVFGALGLFLTYKRWSKSALLMSAIAGWFIGHGTSENVTCGVGTFNYLWAVAATMGFGLPALAQLTMPAMAERRNERQRLLVAAEEKVRIADEQRRIEGEIAKQKAIELAKAEEDAQEASRRRAEIEAEKSRLREERERSAAEKALHGHVEVITSAVRSIRRDGDNAVLINTIDSELKAIARNERITEAMLTHADLKDDVEVILQMLAERGVDDRILLNRLRKVFQLDAAA